MPAKIAKNVFDQHYMPIWCEGCNEQGYIFDESVFEDAFFVVCPHCGRETSSVNCPKCEIGGEFVQNIEDRPDSWACPDCKTGYSLSNDFYRKPITLYLKSDLPKAILPRFTQKGKATSGIPIVLWAVAEILLFPFLTGAITAILIYPDLLIFAGILGLFGCIIGSTLKSKGSRPLEKALVVCSLLAMPVLIFAGIQERPLAIAAIISPFVLGVLYGYVALPILMRYTPKSKVISSNAKH